MKSIELKLEIEKRLNERFNVGLERFLSLEKEDNGLRLILSSSSSLLIQFFSSFFLLSFMMNGEDKYPLNFIIYNTLFVFFIVFNFFLNKSFIYQKRKNINNLQLNMKNIKEFKENRFSKINNDKFITGFAQLGFLIAMAVMLIDAKHIVKYYLFFEILFITGCFSVCLVTNVLFVITTIYVLEDKVNKELNRLVDFQNVETPKIIKEIVTENNLHINTYFDNKKHRIRSRKIYHE